MKMKKYLSSLIVLTLFLNSFAVFGMKKREEEQEYRRVLNSTTGMNVRIEGDMNGCIENLPDHLITWKILPFLDAESLRNVKNANNFFRKRAGEFLSPTDLKNLENGVLGELFGSFLEHEEIRELVTQLESKIRKDRNLFLYKDVNELKIEDLTEKNVKEELFKIFKDREPKLAKVFDNVIKIFSKISNVQQQVLFEKSARKVLNKIIMALEGLYMKIFMPYNVTIALRDRIGISVTVLLLGILPILFLGKIGLCFGLLSAHNVMIYTYRHAAACQYPENFAYNKLLYKLIRKYCNIPDDLKKCLRSYICAEGKLRKAIYDEQELQEKKNQ